MIPFKCLRKISYLRYLKMQQNVQIMDVCYYFEKGTLMRATIVRIKDPEHDLYIHGAYFVKAKLLCQKSSKTYHNR